MISAPAGLSEPTMISFPISGRHSKTLFLCYVATLVLLLPGCNADDKSFAPPTPRDPLVSEEISELLEEYAELRKERGHFDGGEWDEDLDSWGGRLHTAMTRLGETLGHPPHARADVVRLMGEPDAVRERDTEEHLIYFWRGWHDYLYFVCRDGVVQEAQWYFAGE